jgi:hypothetical protein
MCLASPVALLVPKIRGFESKGMDRGAKVAIADWRLRVADLRIGDWGLRLRIVDL